MTDERWRRSAPRLVLGLVAIGLGILFTLDRLGFEVHAGSLLEYWPVLLIAAGLGKMLQPRGCPGRGFGVVVAFVGTWLLLENLDVLPYRLWDFWPVLLVVLGISMVWRAVGRPGGRAPLWGHHEPLAVGPDPGSPSGAEPGVPAPVASPAGAGADAVATVDCFALLGASRRRSISQDFRGGSLFAMMGGCELDLRSASIRGGQAVLDVFAMWGGIEVKVPQDWSVALHGTPILGGFDDKTTHAAGDGSKVLVVTGTAIMGGVEIKN